MYFLCWPHCNHLALSNTRLYFSTLPGATLNGKIINKKHKNAKHGTKITAQRTLVCSMRAETRRQSLILSSQLFQFFPARHVHMSMNDGRASSLDFGVASKFQQVGELAVMKSANSEDQLYSSLPLSMVFLSLGFSYPQSTTVLK